MGIGLEKAADQSVTSGSPRHSYFTSYQLSTTFPQPLSLPDRGPSGSRSLITSMTPVWGVVKRRPTLRQLCGADNAPKSLVLSRMSGDSGNGECGRIMCKNARRIEAVMALG